METDPEVKEGWGQHYTTYFRQYDPRLGRWWSNDPVTHPGESPYVAMYNNPIYFSDASGASGEGPSEGDEEVTIPPEVGCSECERNVPNPREGQRYFTDAGWGYQYDGSGWNLDPGDEVKVTTDAPEALPGAWRASFGYFLAQAATPSVFTGPLDDPLNMPGEYFHRGQWIPAAEYRAKVQNLVNNIDNPAYDPAQDGFYFGEGSNLQAPFWNLFTATGEGTYGTSNEMLPTGSPNPFAHTGLETPAFAPEALLAGLPGLWRGVAARTGVGGAMARGGVGELDDAFGGIAASGVISSTEGNTVNSSIVPMAEGLYGVGTVRNVAGYELWGNSGLVGNTYNVNVLGLYAQEGSQGLSALSTALKLEAQAVGASQISISGNVIINPGLQNLSSGVAARFGFTLQPVNSNSFFLTAPVR